MIPKSRLVFLDSDISLSYVGNSLAIKNTDKFAFGMVFSSDTRKTEITSKKRTNLTKSSSIEFFCTNREIEFFHFSVKHKRIRIGSQLEFMS